MARVLRPQSSRPVIVVAKEKKPAPEGVSETQSERDSQVVALRAAIERLAHRAEDGGDDGEHEPPAEG